MPDQNARRRAAPWRCPHWSRRGFVPCCVSAVLLALLIGTGPDAGPSPAPKDETVLRRTATLGGTDAPIEEPADVDEETDRFPPFPD